MIIYGDMQTVRAGDGKTKVVRKLRFRSDGNIVCGTRFTKFPSELDHDVKLFVKTFKDVILDLYNGDKEALEKEKKEQQEKAEQKAKAFVEAELKEKAEEQAKKEDVFTAQSIIDEITEIIATLDKEQKIECAKYFKENLGNADYRKSVDVEALQDALEFTKQQVEELE